MPYANLSDVRGLAPHVPINSQSQPSEGTILQWITDVDSTVDATVKGIGYAVPVTGTFARSLLKTIVAHAVMARVMRARPNREQDPEAFQKIADDYLKRLRDPRDPLELTDAEKLDAPIKESSHRVLSNLKDLAREDPLRFPTRDQVF